MRGYPADGGWAFARARRQKGSTMPGRTDRQTKERLKAQGKWPAFLERRTELREQGYAPKHATRRALLEVQGRPDGPGPLGPMPPEVADRRATEADAIRWCADNMDNPDPDPVMCPNGAAWTLLRRCREDPAFYMTFIGSMWAKLIPPGGGQPEADACQEHDSSAGDVIARIQALSASVKTEFGT